MNASVASMIYKFNMNNIKILEDLGYQVDVACNFGKENPISEKEISNFRKILKKKNIRVFNTTCPRNILAIRKILIAYKQLKKLASREKYDLVHTQSPIGGVICRLSFYSARKSGTRVIYQAHGFHFYKGAPIINWLIFYPIEKICSYFTDVIITINKEDYELAKKKLHAKKVKYVPGIGLDTSRFDNIEFDKRKKCQELGIDEGNTILLSVGELNENKNHYTVIRALGKLNKRNFLKRVSYLICGQGEKIGELKALVKEEGLNDVVKFLGFRTDIPEIYKIADVFIFPSFREGLSVSLMEAMVCGLPCIVSKIRGNTDLIDSGKGGRLVQPSNIEEWTKHLSDFIKNGFPMEVSLYNKRKINDFLVENVMNLMRNIYRDEK